MSYLLECKCNTNGSMSTVCNKVTGKCPCFPKFGGEKCEKCANNFYAFPECEGNHSLKCDF